jgi:hypothetical protein
VRTAAGRPPVGVVSGAPYNDSPLLSHESTLRLKWLASPNVVGAQTMHREALNLEMHSEELYKLSPLLRAYLNMIRMTSPSKRSFHRLQALIHQYTLPISPRLM